jgi:hypothetical protein
VLEVDMADPEFFKQPFPASTNEYAPSNLKIEPFNCSPEGVTGTIKKQRRGAYRRYRPPRLSFPAGEMSGIVDTASSAEPYLWVVRAVISTT